LMLAEPLSERNRGIGCGVNIVCRCLGDAIDAINVVRDKKVASVDYWQSGHRVADGRNKCRASR
jgi:hypothetical protein